MEADTITKLREKLIITISHNPQAQPNFYTMNRDTTLNELVFDKDEYVALKEISKHLNIQCSYMESRFKSELLEYNNFKNKGVKLVDEDVANDQEYRFLKLHQILYKRYEGRIPVDFVRSDEDVLRDLEAKGVYKYQRYKEIPKTSDWDDFRTYFTIYNRVHKQKSRARDQTIPKRSYVRQRGRNVRQNHPQVIETIEQPGFILEIVEPDETEPKAEDESEPEPEGEEVEEKIYRLLKIAELKFELSPNNWDYVNRIWGQVSNPGMVLTESETRYKNDLIEIYRICKRGPFYRRS